jgi:hypothetical protein
MRIIYKWIIALYICLYPILFSATAQQPDSLNTKVKKYSLNYNQIPEIYQGMYRYHISSDYTGNMKMYDIDLKIQTFLSENNMSENQFEENYRFIQDNYVSYYEELKTATELELLYGVWRSRLLKIQDESEIKMLMDYGVNYLLANGYTRLEDILPFVTMLMQENYEFHYDKTRIQSFGEGATGIITTVDIIKTFETHSDLYTAGVCRDVHDMGLRMLREICTTYYSTLYPEKNINIDDYLFLTSWATHNSQHVTISLIDPLNEDKTYELDWGRFIEKYDNVGYEHGRNYGNVYRVWNFDPKKNITRPIDSKKTGVGNFFDDNLYSTADFDAFTGIKCIEPYSSFKMERKYKRRISLNSSIGIMSQNQKFIMASLFHTSRELKIGKYIKYDGIIAFQTMLMEEHQKKNLMFPIHDFTLATVLYGFPRYIANFRSNDLNLGRSLSANLYLANSIELFVYEDYFHTTDAEEYNRRFQSGDGSVFLTQGLRLHYKKPTSIFESELKIQNRGFLIPKEVRLMSANPFELVANATMVSPAKDIILNNSFEFTNHFSLTTRSILEFTNQKNLLTLNSINVRKKMNKIGSIDLQVGFNRNLKGHHYFWYPVNKNWVEIGYLNRKQNFRTSFAIQNYNDKEFSCGVQLTVGI